MLNFLYNHQWSDIDVHYNQLNSKDWGYVSAYFPVDEMYFKKYKDKIHWGYVSYRHKKLSAKFIIEFSAKLYVGIIPVGAIGIKNKYSWKTFL